MRDLNNLNREHDEKIKWERATLTKNNVARACKDIDESFKQKSCCGCPETKEHIYCGCDCHDVPMNDEN
jgi:hypothetical protein